MTDEERIKALDASVAERNESLSTHRDLTEQEEAAEAYEEIRGCWWTRPSTRALVEWLRRVAEGEEQGEA